MNTAVILTIVIAVLIGILIRKNATKLGMGKEYDEMQKMIRAEGYRLGFCSLLICVVLSFIIIDNALLPMIAPATLLMASMLLSIALFAVYCIMKGAFFAIDQRNHSYVILITITVITNAICAILRIKDSRLLENGVVTPTACSNLFMTLTFLSVLIAMIAKRLKTRREDAE